MNQGELRRELALMIETACPIIESSDVAYPWRISSILDDANGKALVQVSLPVGGVSPEHLYTDYQEKLVLIYDGHLYNPESMASKLSQVHHMAKETLAESLVHLLAEISGNLEEKVRRALTDLDGDYALAVSDSDRIVISRNSLGTKPLYFAENNRFSAFASNKKPLWKIGLSEVTPRGLVWKMLCLTIKEKSI
jgi:asparagine synthetase B (glutamine-hydrolysing)